MAPVPAIWPLVVAGPSGVGKGTLLARLRAAFPDAFGFSISYTSRPPRPGEEDGVHYYFVTKEQFLERVKNNQFLEYADNFGSLYGTTLSEVERNQKLGKICLLEIDIQGVRQIKESAIGEDTNYVFVSPPSMNELERRLRTRGTEMEDKIKRRLEVAKKEMQDSNELGFDVIIINDDLDNCLKQLKLQVLLGVFSYSCSDYIFYYCYVIAALTFLIGATLCMLSKIFLVAKHLEEMRLRYLPLVTAFIGARAQLHFASLGNWGSGGEVQKHVASTLKKKAERKKISFVVSPGSNFPSEGVQNLEDDAWKTRFNSLYEGPELYLPFFTVLGSDDWKGNHSALALKSVQDYGSLQTNTPKWTLPNWWYHHTFHFQDATGNNVALTSSDVSIAFVFIDTFILSSQFAFANITKLHWDALRDTIGATVKAFDWTVVVGDKALLSSGQGRGDLSLRKTLGAFLKEQRVDAYISGSDNDLEIIKDGDLTYINCGSGSKGEKMKSRVEGSVVYFGTPGFCHHIVTASALTTELIDGVSGDVLFEYSQSRISRPRSWLQRFNIYKGLSEIQFIPIPHLEGVSGPAGYPIRRPSETDLFVRIIGTLGLLVVGYVAMVGMAATVSRAIKSQ